MTRSRPDVSATIWAMSYALSAYRQRHRIWNHVLRLSVLTPYDGRHRRLGPKNRRMINVQQPATTLHRLALDTQDN